MDIRGDSPPTEQELTQIFAALKPSASTRSRTEQMTRGALATLPYIGGTLGGIAGSAASPIIGTAAGAGGGAALGEGLRQLANQYMFGDQPDLLQQGLTGASAALGTGAIAAAPAATSALSPSAILSDIERKGTISPGVLGAEAIKRAATALRPANGPLLQRPLWQANEGQTAPLMSDRFRPNVSGAVGRGVIPEAPGQVLPNLARVPQATYTQLPNGEWGIVGRDLVPGESVNISTRGGLQHIAKVAKIVGESGGNQYAMIENR